MLSICCKSRIESWRNRVGSCPSEKDDLKKIEKNNVTSAVNVLYAKKEKMHPAYVSKKNSNREKQVILLINSKKI